MAPRTPLVRRGGRLCAALLAAAGLAACGDLPTSPGVHVVRRVPADAAYDGPDVTKYPYGPTPGATPARLVLGFIAASAGQEDDPAVARDFLAPDGRWDSDTGASVYDLDSSRQTITAYDQGRTVVAKLAEVGVIDPDGGYRPAVKPLTLTYRLRRVGADWRIVSAPSGLLLTERDVERDYRAATVYRLARDSDTLVPDQVQLFVQSPAFPSAVVRSLLRGPSRWLLPAVRSGIPSGTLLIDSATLVDSVVTVNFSRQVAALTGTARTAFLSQVVATLDTVPGVERVRILVEGRRLLSGDGTLAVSGPPLPGSAAESAAARRGVVYSSAGGRVVRLDPEAAPTARATEVARAAAPLTAPAAGPDGTLVSLRGSDGDEQVAVGEPGRGMVTTGFAGDLTAPTWVGGLGALVATRGNDPIVRLVRPDGSAGTEVRAPGLGAFSLDDLRVSQDGARVAAVVGAAGSRYLLLGRVGGDVGPGTARPELTLNGWERLLLPSGLSDVTSVAWEDGLTLAVVGNTRSGQQLWHVSLDGSPATVVPLTGVPSPVTGIAAETGRPLLVSARGDLWREVRTGWQQLSPGTDPTYAG